MPFYIGIGKTAYRPFTKQNRNNIWDKIVAKTTYDVEVLIDEISWEQACEKEKEFIKLYGRINIGTGVLANMTDGGDGNWGLKHTDETKAKVGAASRNRPGHWKGKNMPKAACEKMSASKKGKAIKHLIGKPIPQKTIDAVIKHSIGNDYHLGKVHSDESKKRISESRIALGLGNPVLKFSKEGTFICEYSSAASAAKEHNCSANTVLHCCNGKTKIGVGFIWKFKNKKA